MFELRLIKIKADMIEKKSSEEDDSIGFQTSRVRE